MKKNLLIIAMGLLAAGGMSAQTSYTPSTLTKDGGTYYVYNPLTKLWLQNNNTVVNGYTTGLNVGTIGLPFTFYNPGESTAYPGYYSWFIDGQFAGNGNIDGAGTGDGDLLYMDHIYNQGWDVAPVTQNPDFPNPENYPNAYLIEGGKEGFIFGVDQDVTPAKLSLEIDNESNAWILVTPENRLEVDAANATPENPVDVTYLIKGSTLPDAYNAWNWVSVDNDMDNGSGIGPISSDGGYNLGSCVAQRVHEYWSTKAFDFYQVLTGIPNGTYEFSVRGFYRDGSTEKRDYDQTFVAANRQNGTEQLRAEYYAGSSSAKLMSIIDGAKTALEWPFDGDLMLDATASSGLGYVPNGIDQANLALFQGAYQNKSIKVIVTNNTLRIGVRKSEGVADDWTVFSNFTLKYAGADISGDVTELIKTLQQGIDEANAFTGLVPPTYQASFQAAKDAANAALSSTDVATINDATSTLAEELSKVKLVTKAYTNLVNAISLAKSLGSDDADLKAAIENAENVAATGTTSDEFNSPIVPLTVANKNAMAQKVEDGFTGAEPADGEFYIYNIGAKRFLQGGSDWGTHAAVGTPGLLFTLAANGDGYTLNREGGAEGRYMNYGGYTDTGAQDVWKFVAVDGKTNVYTIERNGTEGDGTQYILAFAPGSITDAGDGESAKLFATVSTIATDKTDAKSQWKLVSKEERDQLLATATEENPQDATYKLQSPGFEKMDQVSGWLENSTNIEGHYGVVDADGRHQDFAYEGWNVASFDLSQTVDDLPAGYYQIKFNGLYRDGSREAQQAKVANGDTEEMQAYLYIELGSTLIEHPLVSISEGINKLPGFGWEGPVGYQPDDVWSAIDYFELGQYKNATSPFELKDGQQLYFGIAKDEENKGDWIVVDNFQLIYFGTKQPTAIKGISTTEATDANAPAYNVSGQRVGKGYKGIVIQNGKKRIVK